MSDCVGEGMDEFGLGISLNKLDYDSCDSLAVQAIMAALSNLILPPVNSAGHVA